MRHKYAMPALVLGKNNIGEASSSVVLLTPDFGIIRVRSQGLRKPAAKMSAALQTFSVAEVSLIRGKDGWRTTGAILGENLAATLNHSARLRAGRITDLLQRLTHGELRDSELYTLIMTYVQSLPALDEELADAAECLTALRMLQILGFDAGIIPGEQLDYSIPTLTVASLDRAALIVRVNNGLSASGL